MFPNVLSDVVPIVISEGNGSDISHFEDCERIQLHRELLELNTPTNTKSLSADSQTQEFYETPIEVYHEQTG